jgi:high-affinity K+ transport system ATPase subunit B
MAAPHLVVSDNDKVMGVIELQDIIKPVFTKGLSACGKWESRR